jgi:hypothetical protein
LLFLVVREITPLFLLAYAFALLGIGAFWLGSVYLFDNIQSYPWLAAFPALLARYLCVEVIFSAVFVALEQLSIFRLPPVWFFLIHALIAAYFAVNLVLLQGGKEIIERRGGGAEVKEKTRNLAFLLADVSAILERTPEMAKDIQPVADALRYSDPMSHPSLEPYENAIKDSVVRLEQAASEKGAGKVSDLCAALLRQIKDRNNRAKLMK